MKKCFYLAVALVAVSACDVIKNPTDPSTPAPSADQVNYTAVGASDAIGWGGTVYCLPFTACPDGTGYVPVTARRFQANQKTVTLMNLGIPGAVLSPQIQAIGAQVGSDIFGNFLDQEMPFVPKNSTLVTIFAGGNDANTIGKAVDHGLGGSDPNGYIASQTQAFGRDMLALINGIKGRAASARIVVLNLPNLAGLPYASGLTLAQKRGLQQIAVGFSSQINALGAQGVLVLDLMCDSRFYQPSSLSSDGFHPNDTGYAYLADLVYAAAATGTVTPPRASCSQMGLY